MIHYLEILIQKIWWGPGQFGSASAFRPKRLKVKACVLIEGSIPDPNCGAGGNWWLTEMSLSKDLVGGQDMYPKGKGNRFFSLFPSRPEKAPYVHLERNIVGLFPEIFTGCQK